jgi:LuxR family transcriptional regulator, maltose regulon positive regulatory protein
MQSLNLPDNAEIHTAILPSEAEPGWLLVGKLAPPQQRITVASQEILLERLDSSLSRSVSLIISPAGFGKTTLLTQWWRTLEARPGIFACWLTLDEIDSEVSRFVAGIILAVARSGVEVGPLEVAARQQSIDPNVRPIALALLEAIRRSGRRVVLILDDFHRARSVAVDQVIETMIEHNNGELHLVVSGRVRPTFHVSALFARGLVTILDASDLALSLEQAAQVVGSEVSATELAILHARTEGWAVALQLARLWLDRGGHRADSLKEFSGRQMTDYLSEQIVADLPDEVREFLQETAILERFDAGLANAVRQRSDGDEMLDRLQHFDALLVPLDGTRDWFRYHPLFADFLCQRLKRSSAQRELILHRRAARALAAVGDLPEAVQHAIRAKDVPLAVALTQEAGGWELILWKGIGYVRSVLKNFDELTIRSEVTLLLTQAYLDIKLARFEAASELLSLAGTMLSTSAPRTRRDVNILQSLRSIYIDDVVKSDWTQLIEQQNKQLDESDHLGRGTFLCALALTALSVGAVERAESESRRAIQEMRAAGSVLGTNYAFLHLAQSQLLKGHLREAESVFREALVMAEDNFGADSGLKALSSAFLGYCLYLKGDIDGSSAVTQSCAETTDGWVEVFAAGYEVRVRQAIFRGAITEAIEAVADATRVAQARHLGRLGLMAAAWRVEILALSGRHQEARREAQIAGVLEASQTRGPPDYRWRARIAATLAVGRLLAVSGASAQALLLVDAARSEFRAARLILPASRLDALSVVILQLRGATEEALLRLHTLLEYVVTEGAIGVLLEQGAGLEALLHMAQRRNRELMLSGAQREVTARVLILLQRAHVGDQSGFSSRELEVLRELCNGRSNKTIGQLLNLSENTVKFHLKRIFKKLETDSRVGAIATAVKLGLFIPEDSGKKQTL